MKRYTFILIIALLFAGCSFKSSPKFKYRVNASNSFDSYTDYYLKGETRLASTELKRAVQNAKEGYDLETLSKIYLGECALHIAILIHDPCDEYNSIKGLLKDKSDENYYRMIQGDIENVSIDSLPKEYRSFANYLKHKEYKKAFEAIKEMENVSSKLIAASIMKEHLTKDEIRYILSEASAMGYKKALKSWYSYLKSKSNQEEQKIIDKKMEIFK